MVPWLSVLQEFGGALNTAVSSEYEPRSSYFRSTTKARYHNTATWHSKILVLTLCSAIAYEKWYSHTRYSFEGTSRFLTKISPPRRFFQEYLGDTWLQLLVIHNFQHIPFYPRKLNQLLNENILIICLFF